MAEATGPTLTRIAFIGRLAVKYGLIGLVTLIVGRTFLTASYNFYVYLNPPPPPPPTVGFGILPAIAFPPQTSVDKPKQYRLETANGAFPSFPDRAKVFLAQRTSLSLLADQKAKQIAQSYGFVSAPSVLSTQLYRWTKQQPLQATLEMNLQNFHFDLDSDFLSRPELLARKNFAQNPAEIVKSFISGSVGYDRDIATPSGKVSYLRSTGTDVVPAFSLSDADFLAVDLQRAPIDSVYPFYTEGGNKGVISAILTGGLNNRDQIVRLSYKYQKLDYTQIQTYPLRDVNLAWQELQAGEGFIAHNSDDGVAVVREVSLGYYDDIDEQDYAQPIYVFAGDNNFLGFVPAVSQSFVEAGVLTPSSTPQTVTTPLSAPLLTAPVIDATSPASAR